MYVGISNYNQTHTAEIHAIFTELKTPFIVNQPPYSMLNRWVEEDGLDRCCLQNGIGLAVFSPLCQGLLTDRYLHGIPADSCIGNGNTGLSRLLTEPMRQKLQKLNVLAAAREQTLSQMAITGLLHNPAVATVLTGARDSCRNKFTFIIQQILYSACFGKKNMLIYSLTNPSRPEQIIENVKALEHPNFTEAELAEIKAILAE